MRGIMKPEVKPSDTQSVISDAGTSISGCGSSLSDNREDLQEFAFRLGLPSVDHLTRDRFRVDRRKLESMILGEEHLEPADVFFQNIMESTETRIVWPVKLKIGAKSKKDPCIRIAGRTEDVAEAKKKILAILETRPWVINFSSGYKGYRVTMKLDVSYTDHSHIIGKGGQTIKSVMEKTGCHIHFPDSNRINQTEKSNQISIAGEMTGVERARARVRELTPLIFSFELPLLGGIQPCPEQNCEEIKEVEGLYNVQVMFRTRPKLHSTLVVVKGCEWELASVKEATIVLMNKLCDSLANQMPVHMSMEISPIHHSVVLGRNNTNLKTIMHHTGVQVMFPDANDPNIPSLKKSSVTITGGINQVYLARQMLLGSLPMVIMFDITGDTAMMSNEQINELMHTLDVVISVRYKPKQSVTSVSIRGVERNASNVYEARRILLKLNEPSIKAVIPDSYNIPSPTPSYLFNAGLSTSPGAGLSNLLDNRFSKNNNISPINYNILNSRKVFPSELSQLPSSMWPLMPNLAPQFFSPNQRMHHQEQLTATLQNHQDILSQSSLSLPDIKDCQGAYSSLSSNTSSLSSPTASPRNVSPIPCAPENKLDLSSLLTNLTDENGFERPLSMDYNAAKMKAFRTVQNQNFSAGRLRIPTTSWCGLGFSQSSPTHKLKEQLMNDNLPVTQLEDANSSSPAASVCSDNDLNFAVSSYLDSAPGATLDSVFAAQERDITSLFISLGFEKYIPLFKSQEIDLYTFMTLSDCDLKEIGVNALGARRKLLLTIAELKKRKNSGLAFNGSAAPGAERKGSRSSLVDW
nr:PREDICTED: protein bicaudal C [Bemisia tabaci]